jgi:cystathionine beta-synthase
MKFYNDVISLIGNTPLVKINNLADRNGIKAQMFAKMENLNPGFSVKDRIGISMIEAAEKEGLLKKGRHDYRSDQRQHGHRSGACRGGQRLQMYFRFDGKSIGRKIALLEILGPDVVICPAAAKPERRIHYVETAKRIASELPNSFYPDQYNHPANPAAHYRTTGPEIWNDTDGKITHFISSIGTGGTISGTGRYLKEKNPKIKIIGADPYGSIFKTYKESVAFPKARLI